MQTGEWQWKITYEKIRDEKAMISNKSCWKDFLMGKCHAFLPYGDYELISTKEEISLKSQTFLKKLFINEKVPYFLRSYAPILCDKGEIFYDFLSGKNRNNNFKMDVFISIEIKKRDKNL